MIEYALIGLIGIITWLTVFLAYLIWLIPTKNSLTDQECKHKRQWD